MAILIKNADVPKCCKECKFKYAIGCRTYTGFHHQDTERAAKCPLVEVWDDYQKCIEALPSAQPDRDALEMAYAHGETAAEARYYEMLPKWLPVTKDTLPIKGKVVIVKGKTGTWDFGTYRGYSHVMGEGDIHKWNWKKNTLKSVYWWMYKDGALPEPTGGEQE